MLAGVRGGVFVLALLLGACGGEEAEQNEMPPAAIERTEYAFTGTVQQVDTVGHRVTVQNDDVPGWMGAMIMSYGVDDPAALAQVSPGDRVKARVYSGDFATLYGLEPAN